MRASTGLVYVCACVHECISNYTMSKSHIHYLPQVGTGAYLSSLLALFVSVYWLWSSLASSRELPCVDIRSPWGSPWGDGSWDGRPG